MEYRMLLAQDLPLMEAFLEKIERPLPREFNIWQWALKQIAIDKHNFLIPIEISNGKIVTASISYSFDRFFNLKPNTLPYWVLGLTRSWSLTPLAKRLDLLYGPVMTHFEAQGMTTFFSSRFITSATTHENDAEWLQRAEKKIGITRYIATVDKLIKTHEEYERLSEFHKAISHSSIRKNKCIAIMRHDLLFSERKQP